jgi:SAM-dependent methyltransferase
MLVLPPTKEADVRVSDVVICAKHDLRTGTGRILRRLLGRPVPKPLPSRVPTSKIKRLILKKGFAVSNGGISWFYDAYSRGNSDPLTNFAMDYVAKNTSKDAAILVTGCGTGITALYLADLRFTDVSGMDLLSDCIEVANAVKSMGHYNGVQFFTGDGFAPQLSRKYDVITALHWVFSAWMGNYGNNPVDLDKASSVEVRQALLRDFFSAYVPFMNPGAILLIELTDAVADYRIPSDHAWGERSRSIYPVRHTPEQVERVAAEVGLAVVDRQLCVSFGHHPRTLYVLKR